MCHISGLLAPQQPRFRKLTLAVGTVLHSRLIIDRESQPLIMLLVYTLGLFLFDIFIVSYGVSSKHHGFYCPGIIPGLVPKPKLRPQFFSSVTDDMVYRDKEEPFRASFILDDAISSRFRTIIQPTTDYVSDVLGPILSAKRLRDHLAEKGLCNTFRVPESGRKGWQRSPNNETNTIVIYVYISKKAIQGQQPCVIQEGTRRRQLLTHLHVGSSIFTNVRHTESWFSAKNRI